MKYTRKQLENMSTEELINIKDRLISSNDTDSRTTRQYGCSIPYASNYDENANSGCPAGTFSDGREYSAGSLFCCDFSTCTPYMSEFFENQDRDFTFDYLPPEDDCGTDDLQISEREREKLDLETSKLLKNENLSRDSSYYFDGEPDIAIPLVFWDVYGGSGNKEGRPNIRRSFCNELTNQEGCECRAYRATQILSEQYSYANIRFYRACRDENGVILSEEQCNRNEGNVIPWQDVPDKTIEKIEPRIDMIQDLEIEDQWFEVGDNAFHIFTSECLESPCNQTLNGFASFPSFGTDSNRIVVVTTETFYYVNDYKENNELFNWGTIPHEFGHSFNLEHIYAVGLAGSTPDSRYPKYGKEGFELFPTNIPRLPEYFSEDCWNQGLDCLHPDNYEAGDWTNMENNRARVSGLKWVYEDNNQKFTTCAAPGNEGYYDYDSDTLFFKHNTSGVYEGIEKDNRQLYYSEDVNGRPYGTRCMDGSNDYQFNNITQTIIDNHYCGFLGTCQPVPCNEEVYTGVPYHNFLNSAANFSCRNSGCADSSNNLDYNCTPLPGYNPWQFTRARQTILQTFRTGGEDPIIGCNIPGSTNYSHNHVVIDNTYCESDHPYGVYWFEEDLDEYEYTCPVEACNAGESFTTPNIGNIYRDCIFEDFLIDCFGECKLFECPTSLSPDFTSLERYGLRNNDEKIDKCGISIKNCICEDQGFSFTCYDGECVNDESECFNNNVPLISCETNGQWTCPDYSCADNYNDCNWKIYDNPSVGSFGANTELTIGYTGDMYIYGLSLNDIGQSVIGLPPEYLSIYNEIGSSVGDRSYSQDGFWDNYIHILPNQNRFIPKWTFSYNVPIQTLNPNSPAWNPFWGDLDASNTTEPKGKIKTISDFGGTQYGGLNANIFGGYGTDWDYWPPSPHQLKQICMGFNFYMHTRTNPFSTNFRRSRGGWGDGSFHNHQIYDDIPLLAEEVFGNGDVEPILVGYYDAGVPPSFAYRYATYSCVPTLLGDEGGCTDATAYNYNPNATFDDETCISVEHIEYGCTDPSAANYTPIDGLIDDGNCVYQTYISCGCINPLSNQIHMVSSYYDCPPMDENGVCMGEFADEYELSEGHVGFYLIQQTGAEGFGRQVRECETGEVTGGAPGPDTNPDWLNIGCRIALPEQCVTSDDCIGTIIGLPTEVDTGCFYVSDNYPVVECVLTGCTDPDALNYNVEAGIDDGSCVYDTDGDGIPDDEEVFGCTDSNAINYNPNATEDDGTCEYSTIIPGDLNGDGILDIGDIIIMIDMILGNQPANVESGDMNGDGTMDISDIIILIDTVLLGNNRMQSRPDLPNMSLNDIKNWVNDNQDILSLKNTSRDVMVRIDGVKSSTSQCNDVNAFNYNPNGRGCNENNPMDYGCCEYYIGNMR